MAEPGRRRARERCPQMLTVLSVAYFALVGMALRGLIALLTKHADFGLTTTSVSREEQLRYHHCFASSSGSGYFFQNILGCILMAIVARHKPAMDQHLAVGLGSGLCGSLTTFATWMGSEGATVLNGHPHQALVSLICMLCVSLSSFSFGHYLAGCGMGEQPACCDEHCGLKTCFQGGSRRQAAASRPLGPAATGQAVAVEDGAAGEGSTSESGSDPDWALDEAGEQPQGKEVQLSQPMVGLIFVGSTLAIVGYLIASWRLGFTEGFLHLAYAPAGALLRWYLSLYNPLTAPFPLFTLVANTLGCVFNALPGILAARVTDGFGQMAVSAIATGFGGCLSTVSTFVGELRGEALGGLRMRVFYFLVSVGFAMLVILPIDTAKC